MTKIDSKIPEGQLAEKWSNYKAHQKLVNPANKRRLDIIVVGTGLAGASAAASLGEMGFRVFNFCIQDSPRRAHSIAARSRTISYFSSFRIHSAYATMAITRKSNAIKGDTSSQCTYHTTMGSIKL